AAASPTPPKADAAPVSSASILVDADTGRVLLEQNAHTPLPPGSLTKTLTAMIAADWLPPGSSVPVTPDAFNAYPDKVGMKPGQQWPLAITLHALITDSANDAAYALAIKIGGSLQGFPAVMQDAGRQIGLADHPVLEDPAGLDGSEGVNGGNRISVWDLAIMGRDMMANPQLATIAGQRTFDFEGPDGIAYHIVSRNWHFLASYPGAIGVKTGFTNAAGYCSMEEAEKGGRHMLAVVLHSTNPDLVAATLMDKGFSTPVAAESTLPLLPEVREPSPAPPPPPPTTAAPTEAAKVAPVPPTHRHTPNRTGWLDVLGAAGIVAGIGVWTRRWVKARQPVPAEVESRR
ncbi:MAG TPA: hypothetical protein VFH58_05320, partial [Acidimicrobiales bacterium]|nr:hypothetical protein [Acidimicrobiales bacterium]